MYKVSFKQLIFALMNLLCLHLDANEKEANSVTVLGIAERNIRYYPNVRISAC